MGLATNLGKSTIKKGSMVQKGAKVSCAGSQNIKPVKQVKCPELGIYQCLIFFLTYLFISNLKM
jgi:hypothetical protein